MEFATNVWTELDDFGEGVSGKRLERIARETLAAAVWELEPGGSVDYHFHHGTRELLLVLRGRLALRTHEGERELAEGEAVAFPCGRDGAHGMTNSSDSPVRYLVVAHHDSPDVIEYPDRGTIGVLARTPASTGEPLEAFFRMADAFER
jgi:uncharacterized cupin superfamily protein